MKLWQNGCWRTKNGRTDGTEEFQSLMQKLRQREAGWQPCHRNNAKHANTHQEFNETQRSSWRFISTVLFTFCYTWFIPVRHVDEMKETVPVATAAVGPQVNTDSANCAPATATECSAQSQHTNNTKIGKAQTLGKVTKRRVKK
jgi:hypothetical protein